MHNLRWICLLTAALTLPGGVAGLTLSAFVDSVTLKHPLIRQQELNPQISQTRRQGYLGAKDWRLTANPVYSHIEPVSTSPFSPTRIDEVNLDLSLGRDIWETGGDVSFRWRSDYMDQDLPSIGIPGPGGTQEIATGTPTLYEHRFSIGYTQPLWRNRGGDLDRLRYDVGAYEISIADLEAAETIEEFVARLADQFLVWVNLSEQAGIIEDRLELARQERELIEERFDVNLVDRADLLRAENAYRNVEQQLVLAESRRDAAAARLAVLSQWENITTMTPEYNLFSTVDLPDLDSAYAMVEADSREIEVLRIQHKELDRRVQAFKETARPQLDLDLSLGLIGGDETFGESMSINDPLWTVGVYFRQPLGANTAKADIKVARLQQKQLAASEENLILEIRASIRSILQRMRDMERVLQLNRETIESAQERWREEQELYREGRGQLVFVIQAQDIAQNARLNYAENATTYHQLFIQLRELTDQLLADARERRQR